MAHKMGTFLQKKPFFFFYFQTLSQTNYNKSRHETLCVNFLFNSLSLEF